MISGRTAFVGMASWHKKVDVRCTLYVTKGLMVLMSSKRKTILNVPIFDGLNVQHTKKKNNSKSVLPLRFCEKVGKFKKLQCK